MSKKIDDLSEMIRQMTEGRFSSMDPRALATMQPPPHLQTFSGASQVRSNRPSPKKQPLLNETHGIESTLFSQVVSVTAFIQSAVENDPDSIMVAEMSPVLDTLRSMVNGQKQENETSEGSRPFSKQLTPGTTTRDLPLPPLDRILAALRAMYDRPPDRFYWPFELGTLGDFLKHVVKACSPGPMSDMELVRVHCGLYWIFTECSDPGEGCGEGNALNQAYDAEAQTCRNSLETILSNLSIHIMPNYNSIGALYMAGIYCLQHGKPYMSWTFISRASLMSQDLGYQTQHVVALGSPEEAQRMMRLFWAVYTIEKALSLRLGRPSTIRDQDITIPRLLLNRQMTSLSSNRLPDWIHVASLYGRIYDYIHSPSALSQSIPVRETRTKLLAAELEQIMEARTEYYNRPGLWTDHTIDDNLRQLIIHANKATDYSILSSIYKALPSSNPSCLTPAPECISAAKASLSNSEVCISMLAAMSSWSSNIGIWINEVLRLAPLIPFLTIFCHIIETLDRSCLDCLQRLVSRFQTLAQCPRFLSCSRQLRIFKALSDAATKYVEVKARGQTDHIFGGGFTELPELTTAENRMSSWFDITSPLPLGSIVGGPSHHHPQRPYDASGSPLDNQGAQLGTWFYQTQQMMRLLDDS
ncbi:hypothetical protein BJY04DRAFT_213926 [Aspergillus karnatakaensis]|uniref:fungal specific transcription factor domain-containing protein n=1 Tax=Aspergillus karnatakaensis TaxID=1810916 RepID=UPI003CCE45CE